MNVSDRSKFGCACCNWEKSRKSRKNMGRTIKRRDRQKWKREIRDM